MMWMMVAAAMAGQVEVTVRTDDGVKESMTVDDAATCATSKVSTRSERGDLTVGWHVRPDGDAWEVHLDIEAERAEGTVRRLRLEPVLRLAEGEKGRLVVGSKGQETTLEVRVKGFDASASCASTRVRQRQASGQRSREVESDRQR